MMQWSLNFSVNNHEIDEQHKILIDIINKVSSLISGKSCEFSELYGVINDLDNYVEKHFKYEEELMRKYNYPEIKEHIIEHNQARLKLRDLNSMDVENYEEFYSGTLIYLVEWLTNHIMQLDKNLGMYIIMKD